MKTRTQEQWRKLVELHEASGKTAVEFCKEHGVSSKYFSVWKNRFLKEELAGQAFVPVKVNKQSIRTVEPLIVHCKGIELKFPEELSAERIGQIIKACAI